MNKSFLKHLIFCLTLAIFAKKATSVPNKYSQYFSYITQYDNLKDVHTEEQVKAMSQNDEQSNVQEEKPKHEDPGLKMESIFTKMDGYLNPMVNQHDLEDSNSTPNDQMYDQKDEQNLNQGNKKDTDSDDNVDNFSDSSNDYQFQIQQAPVSTEKYKRIVQFEPGNTKELDKKMDSDSERVGNHQERVQETGW